MIRTAKFFIFSFLLLTTNSISQVWIDKHYPGEINFFDMVFTDSLNGWITGDSGTVLRSSDGGESWDKINIGASEEEALYNLQILNDSIFIIGSVSSSLGSKFYMSSDFGVSWEEADFPYEGVYLTDFSFVNPDTGFVCGLSGKFFRTYDRMRNWEEIVDTNNFFAYRKILFRDALHGWILGGRIDLIGFVKRTTDGGDSWEHCIVTIEPLLDIFFVNDDTAYVAGGDPEYGGWVYFSSDGGINWEMQTVPPNVISFGNINFENPSLGWVSGAGSILSTTDRGVTWKIARLTNDFIYKTAMINEKVFWFAGSNGFLSLFIDTSSVTRILEEEEISVEPIFTVYPNPFNSLTKIKLNIEKNCFVKMELYNILGERIQIIIEDHFSRGTYLIPLDLNHYSSGIYLILLNSENSKQIQKIVLTK